MSPKSPESTADPIRRLLDDFPASAACREAAARLRDGESPVCGQAYGSSKAMMAAELALDLGLPLLVVTPEQSDAYMFLDDLEFFLGGRETSVPRFIFPHLEVLPYEPRAAERTIQMERLAPVQHYIENRDPETGRLSRPAIVVAPAAALVKRLPPLSRYERDTLRCEKGGELSRGRLAAWLVEQGFEHRDLVAQRGDFSIRGDIADIYSYSYPDPVRIELWGDEIESIRLFDVSTQRSSKRVDNVVFYPGREEALIAGALADGEALQPLWSLFDPETLVILAGGEEIEREARHFYSLVRKRYHEAKSGGDGDSEVRLGDESVHREESVILEPPEVLYYRHEDIEEMLTARRVLTMTEFVLETGGGVNLACGEPELCGQDRNERIKGLISLSRSGRRVAVVCDNEGQKKRLEEIIRELVARGDGGDGPRPHVITGALHRGFSLMDLNAMLCTDREIFGRYRRFRTPARDGIALPLEDLVDLHPGDYVVHIDHGIGLFSGLRRLEMEGREGEFLELRYAENGVLYVPIEQIDRVGRYVGGDDAEPPLAKLGTKNWERTKSRARKAIEDMADELLDLYASRSIQKGHAFAPDTPWQNEFEASFLYEETPDQWRAIEEVKRDMENAESMDRLICGDVGFGKTEVAIRAAFKAVMDGKQVAVLTPTTVLCQQHYNTFRERLAGYPFKVAVLSRFQSPGEIKTAVENIKAGDIDICVGTHRLLSKDVQFSDLGLLIIDEEQRFGVKHKERLRQIRKTVDTLTLSATPIPRTLYMSLSGIRNMSLVSTPPKNRHPIETYIMEWKRETIENAILRELSRDGQVYFVHNKVESIAHIANLISEMVPDARVCVGHGQMDDHELERVMTRFIRHEYDILVATTIIENGLDIPNVNTIIINDAGHFGLAQLYQLRGRVGRDRHRAYCYLLVPSKHALNPIARRRLLALQQHNQLGSGFHLAMRDMEIRGIGNILGREQHGYMVSIGFDLYSKLLRGTISNLRGKKGLAQEWETSLEISPKGSIPPSYVESSRQRMGLHQRIAKIKTHKEIDTLGEELRDIYGTPPKEVERLLLSLRIRVRAMEAGMDLVNVGRHRGHVGYHPSQMDRFDPMRVIQLNGWNAMKFSVETKGERVIVKFEDTQKRGNMLHWIPEILDQLTGANPSGNGGEAEEATAQTAGQSVDGNGREGDENPAYSIKKKRRKVKSKKRFH